MSNMKEKIDWLNERTAEYNTGHPTVSDAEWDKVYFELQQEEKETGIYYPNSPTQSIIYEVKDKLDKYQHKRPMRSLAKTKNLREVLEYFSGHDFVIMPKMDGLSLCLEYRNGKLVNAATRGNGDIGEEVFHNARLISNIPIEIPEEKDIYVYGEVYCPIDIFEEKFSSDYKNPRNFAAGSIRLLSNKESSKRCLNFVAWDIYDEKDQERLFTDRLSKLLSYGFAAVPSIIWSKRSKEFTNLKNATETIKEYANFNHFPIDGIVCRFNNLNYGYSLGNTAHHPRHSLAFKFADGEVETSLLSIDYEVSRTGEMTPVAVFEPVELEGTICSRASLHNISIMEELSGGMMQVGDRLVIVKKNQIIPQVVQWERAYEGRIIKVPSICPICGKPTEIRVSDSDVQTLYCSNANCGSRLINQLDYFVGKNGLDIKGLSKATIEKLIEWGWLNQRKDIFELDKRYSEWIKKDGFGPKSVAKLIGVIGMARKNVDAAKYLTAFGVPLVGYNVSKLLLSNCDGIEGFIKDIENKREFFEIDGIGIEINNSLYNNLNLEEFKELLNYVSIKDVSSNSNTIDGVLSNKIIAITGRLEKISRKDLIEKIRSAGGRVSDAVSSKTTMLISNNAETSAKYKKAQEYGTEILTEKEFLERYFT